jgi:hypothetical protein
LTKFDESPTSPKCSDGGANKLGWGSVISDFRMTIQVVLNGSNPDGEALISQGDEEKISFNLLSLVASNSFGADLQSIMSNWHIAAFHLQRIKWVSPRDVLEVPESLF